MAMFAPEFSPYRIGSFLYIGINQHFVPDLRLFPRRQNLSFQPRYDVHHTHVLDPRDDHVLIVHYDRKTAGVGTKDLGREPDVS